MRKSQILVINGKRDKISHAKPYSGRIKATRGLFNLRDPKTKPMSHRIVRSQMKREFQKEINECS